MTGQERAIMDLKIALEQAVEIAEELGLVVTVEQKPLFPPRMGHTYTIVQVRPKYRRED